MRKTLLFLALVPAALSAQQSSDSARARRDSAAPPMLESVAVRAIRAGAEAPIASKTLSDLALQRRYFGQDVPLLLQGTPSLSAYSETGSYWGYSYMRLRGIDQSRINITIDGIPLNDPEDQVLYFADFPDLANSIASVQIQRGVGTSAPGTASYGGSINFATDRLLLKPSGGEVQLQGGSFGSLRGSAEYAGRLASDRLAVYGRVSALQSNGYRRHSGMQGRSGFLSAAYLGDRSILKLTAIAGLFADTLAYVGATAAELAQDRRSNVLRPDETDRFGEQIVALSYTRFGTLGGVLSATAYRTSASGNYDVCVFNCDQPAADLWNFHLDFAWYGATAAWNYERRGMRANVGLNANTYARDHHAYARPDLATPLYFNTGHKDDASAFAKISYDVGVVTLFGDVAGRRATFAYTPDAYAGITPTSIGWSFVNPKAGATLRLDEKLEAFASFGINSREPARSDMFGGLDNVDTSNVAQVLPLTRVRPERAHDLEAGVRYRGADWSVDANVFAMEFRNEILPVGELTAIGTPLRTNVRRSWRRGVEIDAGKTLSRWAAAEVSATIMRARIAEFTDAVSSQRYRDVEPVLTPRFTSTQRLALSPRRGLELAVTGRYSSRSHLTNTGDASLTLPAYYTADVAAELRRGSHALSLHVNNVADSRRFASGHVSAGEARYYVLPPLNAFLVLKVGM